MIFSLNDMKSFMEDGTKVRQKTTIIYDAQAKHPYP